MSGKSKYGMPIFLPNGNINPAYLAAERKDQAAVKAVRRPPHPPPPLLGHGPPASSSHLTQLSPRQRTHVATCVGAGRGYGKVSRVARCTW